MNTPNERTVIESIASEDAFNLLLWLATALLGGLLLGWVVLGGCGAGVRARVLAPLWPFALFWLAALLVKSALTGKQKRTALASAAFGHAANRGETGEGESDG